MGVLPREMPMPSPPPRPCRKVNEYLQRNSSLHPRLSVIRGKNPPFPVHATRCIVRFNDLAIAFHCVVADRGQKVKCSTPVAAAAVVVASSAKAATQNQSFWGLLYPCAASFVFLSRGCRLTCALYVQGGPKVTPRPIL